MPSYTAIRATEGPSSIPRVHEPPLVGSLLRMRRDPLALMLRVRDECGDFGRFHIAHVPVHVVSAGELAHEILVEKSDAFVKSPGLSILARPLLGNGLLTSEGDFHHRQRKLVAPAFAHKRIAGYGAVMAGEADAAARTWRDGARVDAAAEMMRLTLAIVGKTLFGAELAGEAEEIGAALTVAMEHMVGGMTRIVRFPDAWPTPENLRHRRALARLDATIYRLIRERRATGDDRGDVLSMLLAARDEEDRTGMTDRQVRDEAMTLLLAGHETTANALAWTFLCLERHPDVRARLEAEVDLLDGRVPTVDDMPRLPFTLQVIKEAMRLYPPAYVIGRQATRNVSIGSHSMPAGAIVMINIYGMHRRADYFADPLAFDPSRWAGDGERRLPRGAYLPFGGGPRVCIGNHFALMEAQLALAAIARRVRLRIVPRNIETEPLVTLRPRGGLPAIVERRVLH